MWASYLSALLNGHALEVFVRLSRDDQSDYGQINEVLLTNFDLTKRSFRKKFRDCRPEKAETFRQFSGMLASYLDKRLGLAKVEKTYEVVSDFLAREQFLDCCSHEVYLYLKPKPFKVLGEFAHEADLFADARGGVPGWVTKMQRETKSQVTHTYENRVDRKPNISCKICGKAHQTHNFWHNENMRVSAGAKIASSAEFHSPNQGGKWQNRGRNLNQGRNNYRRNQSVPGRYSNRNCNNDKVEHQVNFCKVEGEQRSDKGVHSVYHAKMHDPIENYRGDNSNWGQDRNPGRVDHRDNHYDNNNYRTDHQVNFCKIGSSDVGKGQAKFSFPHSSMEGLPRKDSKGTCHFPWSRLPTAIGTVNGKEVRVLRDTGCTGVVVRRSLVSDGQMLNKQSGVTLINNYKQRCPVAHININSPFLEVLQMHCALMIQHMTWS